MLSDFGNEELENELEALKAIYMDDCEITKDKGKIEVRIALLPYPNHPEDNYSNCALKVQFPFEYPSEVPIISIEKGKGLSDEQVKELQATLMKKAKELLGSVMVFDLSQQVVEYLQAHNQKPMSFYDEMIARQNAEKAALQKKAESEKKKDTLEELISAELARQQSELPAEEEYDDSASGSADTPSLNFSLNESMDMGNEAQERLMSLKSSISSDKSNRSDNHKFAHRWQKRIELRKDKFGTIYEALNLDTGERMTLKEILVESNTDFAKDKMTEITGEVERLRKLKHDTIVRYLGTERDGTETTSVFRIFQEHFTEGNIGVILANYGPLDEGMIRKYTRQILNGLRYLHKHSVAHGDLKTSSLLLDTSGYLKLTDYGVSKHLVELLDSSTPGSKNALYWSSSNVEETSEDLEAEIKQDIYSLGVTIIEMAGGDLKKKPAIPEKLSRDAREFLHLCMKRNPEDRPDTSILIQHPFVADVSSTIHNFIPLSPPPTPPPTSPGHARALDQSAVSEIASSGETFGITASSQTTSRYRNDFDEIEELGSGGFGVVVKARNKLDGRTYAIKKVKLDAHQQSLAKMVREVTTLSRLNHQYVVRYYQAWLEGVDEYDDDDSDLSEEEDEEDWLGSSISRSSVGAHEAREAPSATMDNSDANIVFEYDETQQSLQPPPTRTHEKKTILYIQMEYCTKRTLRQLIDDGIPEEEERWRLLRQVVEGLNHIHSQAIIHRDLKPSNIFLDAKGDVKIGDFGLATTGKQIVSQSLTESDEIDSKQHTRPGVGTPIYCSPEQERVGGNYDEKVDMYSLGVIFFEMCCRFNTGMERIMTINALKKDDKLPSGFETQHPNEAELIKWLLRKDPNGRPSAVQLMQSNLLPSKMEEEILKEALNTITNPSTTIFSNLMVKLWNLQNDKHLDYTYDYQTTTNFAASELIIRDEVFDVVTNICTRHGAILVETPLLMPKNNIMHHNNMATLLDDSGILLTLPYDLTLPFARYIARNKITNLRRYNVSRVYRKHLLGGKPRELYECDFDIVSPKSSSSALNMVNEAEVLKVITEVMDHWPAQLGSYYIRINHSQLLDAILAMSGLPVQHFDHVRNSMNQLPKYSWSYLSKQLVVQNILTQSIADSLGLYFTSITQIKDMESAISKLEPLVKKSKAARESFLELKYLVRHLKTFKILDKCRLDLSFVFNTFYYEGIIFQAVLENESGALDHKDIIAAGGRYDKLVGEFLPPNAPFNNSAVGVNFAVEKIIFAVVAYEQKLGKQRGVKLKTSDTEVFVCSIGRNMLEDRMHIAAELWAIDIKAEFMHSEKLSLEELYMQCKIVGIPWMIILKDRTYRTGGLLKVKNVEKKTEVEISRDDLSEYMLRVVKNKETAPPPQEKTNPVSNPKHAHEPSVLGTQSSLDIVILNQESNSKLKKKILQMASNKVTPAIRKLATQSLIKVAAIDVPHNIIKEIVASYDPASDAMPVMDKYPRFRDKLQQLNVFMQKSKHNPYVVLYSYRDDQFEVLVLL